MLSTSILRPGEYTDVLLVLGADYTYSVSPDFSPETRAQLIASLQGWNFEPSTLASEDHVAACAILFFEALFRIEGMEQAVGISMSTY